MTELIDKPENPPPETGLDDIAAILAEQIAAGHAAAARCFAMGADEEDFGDKARNEALKIATRLVDSCAKAAQAINRIKGEEFRYRVTVDRVDVEAEKKARRARKKTLTNKKDAKIRESIERKWARILELNYAECQAADAARGKAEKEGLLSEPNVQPDQASNP